MFILPFLSVGRGGIMSSTEIIVIIRPSFKKFCGKDACQAALFNHLLYWIANKAKDQPSSKVLNSEVYWYGSAEDICEGIDNSWSVNKVRKEVKALVEANLIGQRHNPRNGWDQTRHYFIGPEQGKTIREQCEKYEICLRHLGLNPAVLHLLNLVNAFDKNGKCNCQINEMDLPDLVNPSTKSGIAIPKDRTKETSKDTNKGNDSSPVISGEMQIWLDEIYYHPESKVKRQAITSDFIANIEKLLPHIHEVDELNDLCDLALSKIQGNNKQVYAGNLAKSLDSWLQERDTLSWINEMAVNSRRARGQP